MLKRFLIFFTLVVLMLGCASKTVETKIDEEKKPTIELKAYQLVSFGKTKMAIPKKAKILLKDGEYAGYSGCNVMNGTYDIDLDKRRVKFHLGASTLMACPDLALETKFKKYLQAVDNYEIRSDMMILKSSDTEILIFIEQ